MLYLFISRKMASVRLCGTIAVFRNLTRIHANKNVFLGMKRENHALSVSVISFMNRTSSSPLISSRKPKPFRVNYRLEHTVVPPAETVGEKIVSTSTAGNESAKLNSVVDEIKDEKINSNVTSTNTPVDESTLPEIPDVTVLSVIEEPNLKDLGLCGWTPAGIVQQILEYFHVTFDMPWWGCIITLTICVKILFFKLNVKSKRDMVHYRNEAQKLQRYYQDMIVARQSGNYYEAARATQEYAIQSQSLGKSAKFVLLHQMIQAPVFISVYFGLRNMAKVPEFTSFQTGGLLWFTDLTVPDQYYVLPLLTSLSLWTLLKISVPGPTLQPSPSSPITAEVVRIGCSGLLFLFTMNFPSAVLCYWTASNAFAIVQNLLLSLKPVEKYFEIPAYTVQETPPLVNRAGKKLGFIESFKEGFSNVKLAKDIIEREQMCVADFDSSGDKPAKRTFKFNPTTIAKLNHSEKK